jgi:short chain dehydrogenase
MVNLISNDWKPASQVFSDSTDSLPSSILVVLRLLRIHTCRFSAVAHPQASYPTDAWKQQELTKYSNEHFADMGISSSKHTDVKSVWFDDFESKLPSLKGKTVAITGCTSGTGLVVAKTCARKGAHAVLLLNRPSPRAAAAEAEIKHQVPEGSNTVVETIHCDLQDFSSVKNAAIQIKSKYDALDVLCNNAGTFTNEGALDRFSPCCSALARFSACCSALTWVLALLIRRRHGDRGRCHERWL